MTTPLPGSSPRQRLQQRKRRVLLALFFVCVATAALDAWLLLREAGEPLRMGVSVAASVVFSFLLFKWYWLDAAQHPGLRRYRWDVGMVILGPLALPLWFIRSRGIWRGLPRGLGMLLMLAVGFGLAYSIGAVSVLLLFGMRP